MAFSSLADELNLGDELGYSPSGPGLSLADEFEFDMGDSGTLADELVDEFAAHGMELELDRELSFDHLEEELEPALEPNGHADYGSVSSRTPRRPGRGRGRHVTPSAVRVSHSQLAADSGHDIDLSPLHAAQEAGERMVHLLRNLDAASPQPPHSQPSSQAPSQPTEPRLPLEERLQGFAGRMDAAGRVRDEQMREAAGLLRDLDGLREGVVCEDDLAYVDSLLHPLPGQDDDPSTSKSHGKGERRPPALQLGAIDESDSEHEYEYEYEAERSPLSPLDHNASPSSSTWSHSPLSARHGAPLSPLSPSFHTHTLSPTHPLSSSTSQTSRGGHGSTLAAATSELGVVTADAADALTKLAAASSTAVQASAASGETSRQLRKLRRGVAEIRSGADAEDAAQRGVDAWEASLADGSAPDARKVVAELMAGFEKQLEMLAEVKPPVRA